MSKNQTVSIFILIDALGWNIIKDRAFLDDIAVTKRPVKSILGFSSGVIPSTLTGKYPQEHKHWSLYFYSPETSPFRWTKPINWLPKRFLNSRIIRKIVEEISKKLMGYTGYFETYLIPVEQLHLYDISEKKNIYEPMGIRSAGSIFDKLQENRVDYKCYHYPLKDEEIFRRAAVDLKQGENSFYFLYLSASDSLLHKSCDNEADVDLMLYHYELKIRELYQLAMKKYDKVNLYVFSDHGMACVKVSYDLKKDIDELGLKTGIDYIPFYDSTMARFWFFNEKTKEKVAYLLKTKKYGRTLEYSELDSLGINFYGNMYGELIFLMDPGAVINPSYMGNKMPVGMHGYSVNDSSMDAMLVSNCEVKERIEGVRGFYNLMLNSIERKVKIMYFLNSVARGGVEEHVLGLLKHVDKNMFEPILVCPQKLINLLKEDLEEIKVKYYAVDIRRWRNTGEIIKFINIIKEEKPDIVNSHLFGATKFAAPLAKLCGVSAVIETAHLREAWRKGVKKIYALDWFFYRYVDSIIAVSEAVKKYLITDKKLRLGKITVIHNGVDLNKFKPSEISRKTDKFRVGVIGRLEPQKGHQYFLDAVKMLDGKFNEVKFVIVGEGSLMSELKNKCRDLTIEKSVEFLGFRKDIAALYTDIDLVVLPSLYEGLPLVALEAGAMAKPIIVTNVDGSPEVVLHNKSGLVVPQKDSRALKDAMALFLSNPCLIKEFGNNARKHITENFDILKQIHKTENLYKHLLKNQLCFI